ncbi:MAG: MFS transporter [Pirellulaceae bacterium]|nr:MFS transporter [Pirellulaceae bacterium]
MAISRLRLLHPHLSSPSTIISANNDPYKPTPVGRSEKRGASDPLDSARIKAYFRLMPLLFVCYIIAYVDRTNVGVAKLTMGEDLPTFDSWVFGFGSGIFFIGYFLLEIPGSLIVERWSARKWICRIMVTWGIMAAATAFVTTPIQFYIVRFLLGVAEAGFFPGVIVYLTHWFPSKDRARAISYFLIASPLAMMIGPAISQLFIDIGRTHIVDGVSVTNPMLLGLRGWQWIYIFWGIPAVVIGFVVLFYLTDRPRHAKWLTQEERDALENELAREKSLKASVSHHSVFAALTSPRVLLLSLAYFGIVTANYGIEFFLPSILKQWYELEPSRVALLVMIPSLLVIPGQLFIGWSSDHFHERRWHSVLPVVIGATLLVVSVFTRGNIYMSILCFSIAAAGMKSYMPAFWSLPSLFLTSSAAAGSVGMINSIGNLGGFLGPTVMGWVDSNLGSYTYGLLFLSLTSILSASLIAVLPLRQPTDQGGNDVKS